MSHHLRDVLKTWYPLRDSSQWLLATVIGTRGSSYRKPGAMMMFNDQGEQLGVVSGGCLESDILHQARRCWENQQSRIVVYDMQEEGDIAWRLGIGCGGEVTLLLQPVLADNNYLYLPEVLNVLNSSRPLQYSQYTGGSDSIASLQCATDSGPQWFTHTLYPPKSLAILGGGVDAQPVEGIARTLGWTVHVCDPRARYARQADFPGCDVHHDTPTQLISTPWFSHVDAAIVMHHHVELDATALKAIAEIRPGALTYLALLGPMHRSEKVLNEAQITESDLPLVLHAPAGLAIGGELPESIALSMLAQAHAVLHGKTASSLKGRSCAAD